MTVPPPPVVTITESGSSVVGFPFTLNCTATSPIFLLTPPVVMWINVVESNNVTVTSNDLTVSQSTTTVMFDPLKTSHSGVYMCVASYSIPGANLPDLTTVFQPLSLYRVSQGPIAMHNI